MTTSKFRFVLNKQNTYQISGVMLLIQSSHLKMSLICYSVTVQLYQCLILKVWERTWMKMFLNIKFGLYSLKRNVFAQVLKNVLFFLNPLVLLAECYSSNKSNNQSVTRSLLLLHDMKKTQHTLPVTDKALYDSVLHSLYRQVRLSLY